MLIKKNQPNPNPKQQQQKQANKNENKDNKVSDTTTTTTTTTTTGVNSNDNADKPLSKRQQKLAARKQKQQAGKSGATTTTTTNDNEESKENDNNNSENNKEDKKSPNTVPTQSPKDISPKDAPKKEFEKMKNGIQFKELKEGTGAVVKPGQTLAVYYVGQLKDKSIFDKSIQGEGFEFTLGKGEVIKGWEEGIKGMKVGGKRRIVVPPNLAYGSAGSQNIPPNSELTFTVEVRKVVE